MEPVEPAVVVYSTHLCAHCVGAKLYLRGHGIPFEVVDVSRDPEKRAWLVQQTGRRTVPQIFVRGVPIGGFLELRRLGRTGELERMLGAAPQNP